MKATILVKKEDSSEELGKKIMRLKDMSKKIIEDIKALNAVSLSKDSIR